MKLLSQQVNMRSQINRVLKEWKKHRVVQVRALASSQALAVSIFGTMMERGDLGLLTEISTDDGASLLPSLDLKGCPEFDYKVVALNESKPRALA